MIQQSPAYILEPYLPLDLIYVISSFVPYYPKKIKPQVSPSAQIQLKKLQTLTLKGKNNMYMRGLEDFCLD
jgi:hypothetical protein